MAGESVEDIQREFDDLDIEVTDDEVLLKLKELCDKYNIDANKISCEYFSFNTKAGSGRTPTLELIDLFEHDNLRHLKVHRKPLDPIEGVDNLPDMDSNTPKKIGMSSKRNLTPEASLNKRFVSAVGSPSVHSSSFVGDGSVTQASCKYAERKNRGETVLSHNSDLDGDWTPSRGGINSVTVQLAKDCLQTPYRYMFDSLRERAAAQDERICRVGDLLMERLNVGELMDIRTTQVEPQLAVGRICCDSEGHINSNSVVLQSSMDTSAGATVPLDLSKLDSYSLFPGQIVGVECTNPNGARLQALKLHTEPSPLQPAAPPDKTQVLEIMVCCGPFTPQDSDSYQPLLDMLACIQEVRPHLAIFIGPFVDTKNGALDQLAETYTNFFERMVKDIYASIETFDTQVVLVPSQRDLHENAVYPQPAYSIGDLSQWEGKIHSLPDPAVFSVSGIEIGVTSSDILFHLGKEDISFPPRNGDRFSRLANYILSQRSFYPLYPPNLDQNVDVEHLELNAGLGSSPHLMLLPSDLLYFIRDLPGSSTCINPGRITKGHGPGTYAKLLVKSEGGEVKVKAEVKRI